MEEPNNQFITDTTYEYLLSIIKKNVIDAFVDDINTDPNYDVVKRNDQLKTFLEDFDVRNYLNIIGMQEYAAENNIDLTKMNSIYDTINREIKSLYDGIYANKGESMKNMDKQISNKLDAELKPYLDKLEAAEGNFDITQLVNSIKQVVQIYQQVVKPNEQVVTQMLGNKLTEFVQFITNINNFAKWLETNANLFTQQQTTQEQLP